MYPKICKWCGSDSLRKNGCQHSSICSVYSVKCKVCGRTTTNSVNDGSKKKVDLTKKKEFLESRYGTEDTTQLHKVSYGGIEVEFSEREMDLIVEVRERFYKDVKPCYTILN